MNKMTDTKQTITLGLLFMLTIAIAIIGMAAEIVFVTSHLELFARQISVLTIGGISN